MRRGGGHSTAAGVPGSESSSARRGLLSAIRIGRAGRNAGGRRRLLGPQPA
jgi:hypothetical protein